MKSPSAITTGLLIAAVLVALLAFEALTRRFWHAPCPRCDVPMVRFNYRTVECLRCGLMRDTVTGDEWERSVGQ